MSQLSSLNNPPAAGEMTRGPHPRGPKIMTTMKDFIILSKIGMLRITSYNQESWHEIVL